MNMWKLAFLNFKSSFKHYTSLIISLTFTILILFNFQNLIDSNILHSLSDSVLRNVEIIIQVIMIVLLCFMMFFIWYSTNVFLAKRKKEIGIYIFMGLTNQKIGYLYMIETSMIGLISLLLGLFFGMISAQLFQMILFRLSDISVDLQMGFSLTSIISTSIIYIFIYSVFVLKGYINIIRSSVLEMISAARQHEHIKQHPVILFCKASLGLIILCIGYYLAIKKSGMETLNNILLAVVFVIIGIYLLFGGFIPYLCQFLIKRKRYLYKKERILWMNNFIFRIRRNYRTYAMVSVLLLCSATALASGFAMKNRHDSIVHFRNTYTFQVLTDKEGLYDDFAQRIEKENTISYGSQVSYLMVDASYINTTYPSPAYGLLSYSKVKQLAQDANLEFNLKELAGNEYVNIDKKTLLTIFTDTSKETISIQQKEFHISAYTTIPYLGYLQEKTSFYMINDEIYDQLRTIGKEFFLYNYKLTDPYHYHASVNDIQEHPDCMGLVKMDPNEDELQWIRILYSLCVFMFLVFILASGSIIFMKLYNDAFEEKERYLILQKIGVSKKTLQRSITNELRFAYFAPLLIMMVSSYFSVKALGNMLQTDVMFINIISISIIAIFFYICYRFSILIYQKNADIN